MPEERERPRPHGDPVKDAADNRINGEDNPAQKQSDAPPDAVGSAGREESSRDRGRGSTSNGVPEFDEDRGGQRRSQYDNGADLVSGID